MAQQELFDDTAFYYLMTALVAAFWVPLVYYKLKSVYRWFKPQSHELVVDQTNDQSTAESVNKETITEPVKSASKPVSKPSLFSVSNILLVTLTLMLIFLVNHTMYHSTSDASSYASFDPYEILGVSDNATPAQIKKAYRQLSFAYHPDKTTLDAAAAERELLKIQKAYNALTNSEAQANLEKYGNVDGYQGVSVGIGLPSFLTKKENAMRVMLLYVLCLFVLPPVAVLIWLKKSRQQAVQQAVTRPVIDGQAESANPASNKVNKRAVNQANKEAMKKMLKQRLKASDQAQSSD